MYVISRGRMGLGKVSRCSTPKTLLLLVRFLGGFTKFHNIA